MSLLFDQNLSHRLVQAVTDIYPGSQHVRDISLQVAADTGVWDFAKDNGFMIVFKDADFHQRSLLLGYPPKVIWVRLGNCSTQAVAGILRVHLEAVQQFTADATATFLVLS